jgi:hypothetical protein
MVTNQRFLTAWASNVVDAAGKAQLSAVAIAIREVLYTCGPRAGVLDISAGMETGKLLRALNSDQGAKLRQTIPREWELEQDPVAYMRGRHLRLEAPWPDALATKLIRLTDLNKRPFKNGRWCIGQCESGATIVGNNNDATPHWLIAGTTGAGKTIELQLAILQLGQDPDNQIVLLDGKCGKGLSPLAHLPAVVGPVSIDHEQVKNALGWVSAQMRERYESPDTAHKRIIAFFDEFQIFNDDPIIVDLLGKIASQGRGANIHLHLGTQHPSVATFGQTRTRRLLPGKVALKVDDPESSRVAVGGKSPRADHLLGCGDAYIVGSKRNYRVQVAYVDKADFDAVPNSGAWLFDEWPEFVGESLGNQEYTSREPQYTSQEVAFSILAAKNDEGRPAFRARFESPPGANRARRLLRLGKEAWVILKPDCLTGSTPHTQKFRKVGQNCKK